VSRAEAVAKLLTLGDLTLGELRAVMGGDRQAVDAAVRELRQRGVLTVRNNGYGQQLIGLARAPA
jgi:biotin operon repressor